MFTSLCRKQQETLDVFVFALQLQSLQNYRFSDTVMNLKLTQHRKTYSFWVLLHHPLENKITSKSTSKNNTNNTRCKLGKKVHFSVPLQGFS
jgi:hypothetical protein